MCLPTPSNFLCLHSKLQQLYSVHLLRYSTEFTENDKPHPTWQGVQRWHSKTYLALGNIIKFPLWQLSRPSSGLVILRRMELLASYFNTFCSGPPPLPWLMAPSLPISASCIDLPSLSTWPAKRSWVVSALPCTAWLTGKTHQSEIQSQIAIPYDFSFLNTLSSSLQQFFADFLAVCMKQQCSCLWGAERSINRWFVAHCACYYSLD